MADFSTKLRAVTVYEAGAGDEFQVEHYSLGKAGITAIEWGRNPGLHCDMMTVVVFKNGNLHSEHPFANCQGVYYAEDQEAA